MWESQKEIFGHKPKFEWIAAGGKTTSKERECTLNLVVRQGLFMTYQSRGETIELKNDVLEVNLKVGEVAIHFVQQASNVDQSIETDFLEPGPKAPYAVPDAKGLVLNGTTHVSRVVEETDGKTAATESQTSLTIYRDENDVVLGFNVRRQLLKDTGKMMRIQGTGKQYNAYPIDPSNPAYIDGFCRVYRQ